jgi:hypothetical protein
MMIKTIPMSRLKRESTTIFRNLAKDLPVVYEITLNGKAVGYLLSNEINNQIKHRTDKEKIS